MQVRFFLHDREGSRSVRDLLAALRGLFKLVGWDEDDMFRALLVTDEAVQNALDADRSTQGKREQGVRVGIALDNQQLRLTVANEGAPFLGDREVWTRSDILARHEPELMGERGRGLSIMAQYADELFIRQRDGQKIVTRAVIRCKGAGRGGV